MDIRRYMRALGPLLLLTLGGVYALASVDRCGRRQGGTPSVASAALGEGALRVGAARVALEPPYPVVVAGYPPPRPTASSARLPLRARAVVLEVGPVKLGLVSLDLLTLPEPLVAQVRARTAGLGLTDVWLSATHAHSALGGYDPRLLSQLAGTGMSSEAAREAVVGAAVGALTQAAAARVPVTLQTAVAFQPEWVRARSGEVAPDGKLSRVVFRDPEGKVVGQWVLFASHPTLVPRKNSQLDPDWPGRLAASLEEASGGVALLLQGAVGNASAVVDEAASPERAEGYARRLSEAVLALPLVESPSPAAALARVELSLPRPDSARLVPSFLRRVGDNFLCDAAPRDAEVSVYRLGPLKLLAVPGEPTAGVGTLLEQASGTDFTVALVNGYLGYVDLPALVQSHQGESRRQYFGPELAEQLAAAARLAGASVGLTRPPE